MLVSVDRAEKALIYMAESDMEYAQLKADVERDNYICKRTRAGIFLSQETGSIEQKKANAEVSSEVLEAETTRTSSLTTYEYVAAKRKTEQIILDIYRTEESTRRAMIW